MPVGLAYKSHILYSSPKMKSIGVKSGERGGQSIAERRPIYLWENVNPLMPEIKKLKIFLRLVDFLKITSLSHYQHFFRINCF